MKKLYRFLLVICCLMLMVGSSLGEEDMISAAGYTFELHLQLNPNAFHVKNSARVRGYADLLESVTFSGELLLGEDGESFQLNGKIISNTRKDTVIPFQLAGIPSHMVLTSPLLGKEAFFFNNLALVEFALKAWNHFGIPLPYITACLPYCVNVAFAGVQDAWKQAIGRVTKTKDLEPERFELLAASLEDLYYSDSYLRNWLSALSIQSTYGQGYDRELRAAPDYLRKLIQNQTVHVKHSRKKQTWSNEANGVFFTANYDDSKSSFETNLPVTGSGYRPYMCFSLDSGTEKTPAAASLRMKYAMDDGSLSLLDLIAEADWPGNWPVQVHTVFTAEANQFGELLPQFRLKAELEAEPSGAFILTLWDLSATEQPSFLSLSGNLQLVSSGMIPRYTAGWAMQFINLFSVNDSNMQEITLAIAEPFIINVLAFAAEMPATAYQSLLDDLTDFGVISLLLGE